MSKLFVYRASAGSGKTFRLAAEYLKLLFQNPENYKRILAVTFTNKATNEMKGRILDELSAMTQGKITPMASEISEFHSLTPSELQNRAQLALSSILHDYSNFSVSTIDSFVQRVLQSLLWEIGQQGRFEIELETQGVLQQAADNLLDSTENNPETLKWLSSMIDNRLEEGSSWDIRSELIAIGRQLFSETFRLMSAQEVEALTNRERIDALRLEAEKIIVHHTTTISTRAQSILNEIEKNGFSIENFSYGKTGGLGFATECSKMKVGSEYPNTERKRLFDLLGDTSGKEWVSPQTRNNKELLKAISLFVAEYLHNALNQLLQLAAGEERERYVTAQIILKNLGNLGLLADLWSEAKNLSKSEGILLLSDSHHLLREFVKGADAPFVFEKMGTRYDHFLIDEFQDTSVVQWENFKPLIANGLSQGKMSMVVGDVKQSIYRWRNSDWRILGHKLKGDFISGQISEKYLSTNYRSAETIVRFNNLFFGKAVEICAGNLEKRVESAYGAHSSGLPEQLKLAYSDIAQTARTGSSNTNGKVELTLFEAQKNDSYSQLISTKLIELLVTLKKSYRSCDMAILFRNKREGAFVANLLVEYNRNVKSEAEKIHFVSQDGLLLSASAAVRLIMAALRVINDSDNEITRYEFIYELETLKQQPNPQWHEVFSRINVEKEVQWLFSLEFLPLSEIFEKLVAKYQLNHITGELAYISELHELLMSHSAKTGSDLNRFVEWWSEKSGSATLSVPEASDAVTLITIHKSKGLEFPVVIIPFAGWDFSPRNSDTIGWVKTGNEPFASLPCYPVKFNSTLANSFFREQYLENILNEMVDNINLMYVAFTRAQRELHVFVPKNEPNNDKTFSNTAAIINAVLPVLTREGLLTENIWGNAVTYSVSVETKHQNIAKAPEHSGKLVVNSYFTATSIPKIRINRQKSNIHLSTTDPTLGPAMFGRMMHLVFSLIKSASDIEPVINRFLSEGLIDPKEADILLEKITGSLGHEPVKFWFSGEKTILNEQPILTPQGNSYRPDRVVICEKETAVIDFKFGASHQWHSQQVKKYCNLLAQMGYRNVRGYLWYFDSNRIEEVA